MHTDLSGRFFGVLGGIVGVLIGLVISAFQPNALPAINDYFANVRILFIIVLLYVALQFAIGVPFKRPVKSRTIYLGAFAIPLTYGLFMNYPLGQPLEYYPLYYLAVVSVTGFLIAYVAGIGSIVGRLTRFFTGFDRTVLLGGYDNSEAVFCYELEFGSPDKIDVKLVEEIINTAGLPLKKNVQMENGGEQSLHQFDTSCLGSCWEKHENKVTLTIVLFGMENDTVKDIGHKEAALDYQAKVHGMVDSWVQRQKLSHFSKIQPDTKQIEEISNLLGKWKIPSKRQIRQLIYENIGKSRVLTWLVATIVGGAILVFFDKIIGVFWR